MTNALWDPGREGFLSNEIQWDDPAVIKAVLVRGYTFSAAHKFMSDITGNSGVLHGTPQTLSNKSLASGIADADDITFPTPPANASNHSLIIYQASAVTGGSDVAATAQRLIAWMDTGTGFPIVPNGQNIAIQFDSGANKIFKL